MASRIKLKRSTTPNSAPTTSDLTDKEVALNIIDRTLFVNNAGTIEEIANADPNDEKIVPSMFSSSITDGVGNTWYVSTNGTDKATLGSVNPRHGETTGANAWGKTPTTAFASLKYCLDNYAQSGDLVVIAAGQYEETFPLTVPDGIAIKGAGFKSTFIRPSVSTNSEDAFLIEGNCNIEDLCVNDFYYDNVNDTGYAFRLASGYTVATDGRRPYIQRCSVITKGSTVTQADPRGYAAGDAGRGALVDGSIVDASSSEAVLLFNECTFVVPNSVGLYLKNGARCEWLNSFTYFAADSIKGENPGGSGFKGAGKTRLKLNGTLGTFNATDTITYYDTDGTTVLASGTIDSNDGTYVYIDGQGTGQFVEAEADTTGKLVTAVGDAQLDTDIKYFGTASLLLDGSGDYLSLAGSSDFGFGTSDFTVETWIRPTTVTGTLHIYDSRSTAGDTAGRLYLDNGQVRYAVGGSDIVTSGGTTVSVNTWTHIAVVRNSSTTKIYVDGVERGSAADSSDLGSSRALYIGANFGGSNAFVGNIDEFRVSKGLARYTSTPFTVATSEFIVDTNTQLLLHFNGLDGSTDILDGSVSVQDIRSSSGGTAAYIGLADYTDFGAELRSIGSASVYGERGITADGKGVRLRCILHNFGYVGVGEDQSNDISNVNQANEIVEVNGGRALFTSMDQNGDFRVGNAFFVDQENGTVSFVGGTSGGGTTFDQLIVTGTGNTTTILPTSITVGNLTLSEDDIVSGTGEITISPLNVSDINIGVTASNEIDTDAGNLVLDSFTGQTVIDDDLDVVGDLDVTGNITFSGTVTSSSSQLLPDGTLSAPSLSFTNESSLGLYRAGDYKLGFGVANTLVASLGLETYQQGDPITPKINLYKDVVGYVASGVGTFTISDSGLNYLAGVDAPNATDLDSFGIVTRYDSVDLQSTSGSGSGFSADVTITALGGAITSAGSNYTPGSYGNVDFFNVSRTSSTATGSINNPGAGYAAGTYTNVPLNGGDGSGMEATIVTSGLPVQVTSVTITSSGTGYAIGNVLSADDADLGGGGGSGFSYTLDSFVDIASGATANVSISGISGSVTNSGSGYTDGTYTNVFLTNGSGSGATADITVGQNLVVAVNIISNGTGYLEGDTLSANAADIGGTGSGFVYTISEYGRVSNVVVTDIGDNYIIGDTVTLNLAQLGGLTASITNGGSGYTNGTYNNVSLTSGNGSGFIANLTISGPELINGTINSGGSNYTTGSFTSIDVLNVPATTYTVGRFDLGLGGPPSSYWTINGSNNPTLSLVRGNTYKFDVSDSTLAGLTFDIREQGGLTLPSGATIVRKGSPGTSGACVYFIVEDDFPTATGLEYFYPNEEDWGNTISITTGTAGNFGTGAEASLTVDSNNTVTAFSFTNNGSNYKAGDTVSIYANDLGSSYSLTVTNNGSTNFVISGDDSSTTHSSASNPTITADQGDTITFSVNAVGHPFYIVTELDPVSGGYDPQYEVSTVTGQGSENGSVVFDTSLEATGTYYYVCGNHSAMNGTITISAASSSGSGFEYEISSVTVNGSVTNVEVVNPGSGYSTNDILSVNAADVGGTGSGFAYTLANYNSGSGFVYTIDAVGSVTNLNVVSQGSGYAVNDTLSFASGEPFAGFGSGFEVTVNTLTAYQATLLTPAGSFVTDKISIGYPVGSYSFDDDQGRSNDLVVSGLSSFRSAVQLYEGTFQEPSLYFETQKDFGIFFSTENTQGYLNFKTDGGKVFGIAADKLEVYKNTQNVLTIIDEFTVAGGTGYTTGVYNAVELEGGSGTDVEADVYVAFSTGIINGGSGHYPELGTEVYSGVSVTGGSGSGAQAEVTVEDGVITSIFVTTNGTGYQIGDIISVNSSTMVAEDGTVSTGTGQQFAVQALGAVTKVDFTDFGAGYAAADILEFPQGFSAAGSGTGFTLTVDTILRSVKSTFDITTGIFETIGLKTLASGINVNDGISINNNLITRSGLGNLEIGTTQEGSFVKFTGTGCITIPVGDTSERPGTAVDGSIRYNDETKKYEGFSDGFFLSLGGTRDVDGDTYIVPELNPGDDDDTLTFVNADIQSLQVEQSRILLRAVNNITKTNLTGVTLWEAGASVTTAVDPVNDPPVLVYYGQNVYSVDNDGTFDASVAPTHETGTVTNGTVDLTWVRNIYGNIDFVANNINNSVDLFTINSNVIKLSGNSTLGEIGSNSTDLAFTFTSDNYEFIKLGSSGTLSVNTTFGDSDPVTGDKVNTYIQIFDKGLQKFDLKDTRTQSGTSSIDTSSGATALITLFPYTESYSGKIMVEITDDSGTPRKQYSEISYLVKSDGSDILYTESNKIYTDVVLCDVEAELSSGQVSVLVTDVTGSNTLTHSIKVVSNTILA